MRWLAAVDLPRSVDPATARYRLSEVAPGPDGSPEPLVAEVLDRLDRAGSGLADRGTAPGHLTASALVVDDARRHVLVLEHAKLRRWLQPGGHADGDLELAGVALREAAEETGIDGLVVLVPAIRVDVHEVDHGDALGGHLHLDLQFLVAAPPDARARGNHESTDLRWVTPGGLAGLGADEALQRLARAGLDLSRVAPPPPWGWRDRS